MVAGDFVNTDLKETQAMIQINLLGVINGVHAVLPTMIKNKTGTIINISALADRNSRPNFAAYAASKTGVKASPSQ